MVSDDEKSPKDLPVRKHFSFLSTLYVWEPKIPKGNLTTGW